MRDYSQIKIMHDILLESYKKVSFSLSEREYHELASLLDSLDSNYRNLALFNSLKIINFFIQHFPDYSLQIKKNKYEHNFSVAIGNLLKSYVHALENNAGILEDKIDTWTDHALQTATSISDLQSYFEDVHGYFRDDVIKSRGGLPLEKVKRRLQTYLSALTGRTLKIEPSSENTLACSLHEGIFHMPSTITLGKDDDENFEFYKAMGTYQAGAIMLGSYSLDVQSLDSSLEIDRSRGVEGFFNSFSNPAFAQQLFELFEFVRIDRHLNTRYPGLRKTLVTFKETALRFLEKEPTILQVITEYAYGHDNMLPDPVRKEIDRLKKESLVCESAEVVYRVYEYLERNNQIPKHTDFNPAVLELKIQNFDGDEYSHLIAQPSEIEGAGRKFRYPEWNVQKDAYEENFVQVIETPFPNGAENDYVKNYLVENERLIHDLRRKFEALKPEEFVTLRKQFSGEIDYDEFVKVRAEMNLGITPSEKIYTRSFKNKRSVCSLVLSECSGSLGKFIDFNVNPLKIVDIIKQSQISFSEALEQLGDRYALASFSGETERNVEFYVIKNFDEPYNNETRKIIGSVKPLKQNRDGAGIRHATHLLHRQPEKIKLLFYLMEGLPHDFGYEDVYAIEDTKKALIESRKKGCTPVVLTYGRNLDSRIREIGDFSIYREIEDPYAVPQQLPELYRKISF